MFIYLHRYLQLHTYIYMYTYPANKACSYALRPKLSVWRCESQVSASSGAGILLCLGGIGHGSGKNRLRLHVLNEIFWHQEADQGNPSIRYGRLHISCYMHIYIYICIWIYKYSIYMYLYLATVHISGKPRGHWIPCKDRSIRRNMYSLCRTTCPLVTPPY